MPLSEHEQRQLDQIEQGLYRDDPKFGRLVRSSDPRVHYKRKLVQGLVGVLIGAGLIVGGVLTRHVYLELAGAVVLVLSLLWGIVNWQQHRARVRAARARVKGKKPDRRKPPSGGRAGLMERLEERWRRRQEGDRRM